MPTGQPVARNLTRVSTNVTTSRQLFGPDNFFNSSAIGVGLQRTPGQNQDQQRHPGSVGHGSSHHGLPSPGHSQNLGDNLGNGSLDQIERRSSNSSTEGAPTATTPSRATVPKKRKAPFSTSEELQDRGVTSETMRKLNVRTRTAWLCTMNLSVDATTLKLEIGDPTDDSDDDDSDEDTPAPANKQSFYHYLIAEVVGESDPNTDPFIYTSRYMHNWVRTWKTSLIRSFKSHVGELRHVIDMLDEMTPDQRVEAFGRKFDPRNFASVVSFVSDVDFVQSCDVLTPQSKINRLCPAMPRYDLTPAQEQELAEARQLHEDRLRTRVWLKNLYAWSCEMAWRMRVSATGGDGPEFTSRKACEFLPSLCQGVPVADPRKIVIKEIRRTVTERVVRPPPAPPTTLLPGFRPIA